MFKTGSFLFFAALLLLQNAMTAGTTTFPDLVDGHPDTAALLKWSGNALSTLEASRMEDLQPMLEFFGRAERFLEAVPGSIAVKNSRFFGDLQELRQRRARFIHGYGVMRIRAGARDDELRVLLDQLLRLKAHAQLLLPFQEKLGLWEDYYKNVQVVLDTSESHPEQILFEPDMPPRFVFAKPYTLSTLHDILAIYDICKKQSWKPGPAQEAEILSNLAVQYEKAGYPNYALSALQMATHEENIRRFAGDLARLRDGHKNDTPATSLY